MAMSGSLLFGGNRYYIAYYFFHRHLVDGASVLHMVHMYLVHLDRVQHEAQNLANADKI